MPSTLEKLSQLTEDLIELEHSFEHIFNTMPDIMVSADVKREVFTRVNPAMSDALGWSNKELLRIKFIDLIHPDDVEKTRALYQTMPRPAVKRFRNRYRTKVGDFKEICWNTSNFEFNGVVYAVGRVTDEC